MRKGLLLNKRDTKIFIHLSTGPATRKSIVEAIFDKKNANRRTRERVAGKRLKKLEEAGLINAKSSVSVEDTIYILTRVSAPIVAEQCGMDISFVWSIFNENCLDHDLKVGNCSRKLIRDAEQGMYKLTFLELECGYKKDGVLKKGQYLPDFAFGIKGQMQSQTYVFEFDNGTISRKDFIGKILAWGNPTLVVANTEERLSRLLAFLKRDGITKRVYFATYDHFISSSLFRCQWETHLDENYVVLSSQ